MMLDDLLVWVNPLGHFNAEALLNPFMSDVKNCSRLPVLFLSSLLFNHLFVSFGVSMSWVQGLRRCINLASLLNGAISLTQPLLRRMWEATLCPLGFDGSIAQRLSGCWRNDLDVRIIDLSLGDVDSMLSGNVRVSQNVVPLRKTSILLVVLGRLAIGHFRAYARQVVLSGSWWLSHQYWPKLMIVWLPAMIFKLILSEHGMLCRETSIQGGSIQVVGRVEGLVAILSL